LGGAKIQVGPLENDQLLYILTDRCLIYFSNVINWAHSRRDTPEPGHFGDIDITAHLSAAWKEENRRISRAFFRALRKDDNSEIQKSAAEFRKLLAEILIDVSDDHGRRTARDSFSLEYIKHP